MSPKPARSTVALIMAAGFVGTSVLLGIWTTLGRDRSFVAMALSAEAVSPSARLAGSPAAQIGSPAPPPSGRLTSTVPPPAGTESADLRRMIGQMLLIGFPGTSPDEEWPSRAIGWIREGKVGGVLLLSGNVQSPRQLRLLTARLREAGGPVRPLVAVDQEGGAVQRLTREKGFNGLAAAGEIARRVDPIAAYTIYSRQADELAANGVNVNFGPVVDLLTRTSNPIIGNLDRTYGSGPEQVLPYANAFISAHRQKGVLIAAKHFPGHGSSAGDPHFDQVVDVSKDWRDLELRPFARLAKSDNTSMIMVGHLVLEGFSDGRRPASLSHRAVTDRLRRDLGFEGLIVTDDLEMSAIQDAFSLEEAFVLAVAAGNDIVVYANKRAPDPRLPDRAIRAIAAAVAAGRIERSEIERSYRRIMAAKGSLAELQAGGR